MKEHKYYLYKKGEDKEIIYLDYDKLKGFEFNPKKKLKKDTISVNKMIIIKPSLIEKILRKKIKNKLNIYLKLIIKHLEDESDDDGETLREALNDVTRYKSIVEYKYKKYLDKKYYEILMKKIAVLEYEIKLKLMKIFNQTYEEQYEYEEEMTSRRRR